MGLFLVLPLLINTGGKIAQNSSGFFCLLIFIDTNLHTRVRESFQGRVPLEVLLFHVTDKAIVFLPECIKKQKKSLMS